MLDPARSYDLIGDVHGCAHTLEHLLERLGYRKLAGIWRHPQRMAVFLGDIIDRGPRIRESLHIVYDMVRSGQALCLMGNHEFNALGWCTPAPAGSGKQFVREHTPRHARLIHETLEQFDKYPAEWREFVQWFYDMPLFVDAGRFRVVHACWDSEVIATLRAQYPDGCIDEAFLQAAAVSDSFASLSFNRLLRGTDMRLPGGMTLTGGDGLTRAFFRTKFWEDDPRPTAISFSSRTRCLNGWHSSRCPPLKKVPCYVTALMNRCCLSGTTGAAAGPRRSVRTWRAWITARCCTANWWLIAWTRKPGSIRTNLYG